MEFILVFIIGVGLATAVPVGNSNNSPGPCDDGWIPGDDDRCYFLGTSTVSSWDDAQARCWAMMSDLAELSDASLVELNSLFVFLKRMAPQNGQTKFWIGSGLTNLDRSQEVLLMDNGPATCDYIDLKQVLDPTPLSTDCGTKNMGYLCMKMSRSASTLPVPLMTLSDAMALRTLGAPTSPMPTTVPGTVTSTTPDDDDDDDADPLIVNIGSTTEASDDDDADATDSSADDIVTTDSSDEVDDDDGNSENVKALVGLSCPDNWFLSPLQNKCYFIAPRFESGSFMSTWRYCQGVGGRLVQPTTLEEFNVVDNITRTLNNWTQGPWIAVMRPFGDMRIILADSAESPKQQNYTTVLQQSAAGAGNTSVCGGYGPGADAQFQFWECDMMGNPFCERPVEMDFYLLRMTDYGREYDVTSTSEPDTDVTDTAVTTDQPDPTDEK
ncbi:uncharacterized protein LOC129587610 [Paramacrobiotus metropolitanus]|uniref:uncharacterized protein LOC129587610 n=1 Tax=Paramacrobiotus metropolitanus TaxID=2943436 RepID=UPI0024462868|nr:uncharacterized protein LOC129587610 [Paramacrobiotus metropolitanus]